MIAFIEGRVEARTQNALVLNIGGVGLAVQTTTSAISSSKDTARLYTRMIVREDSIELFGFPTQGEVAMFDKLTSVSGIGPKMALAVLSGLSVNDLILAVAAGDEKAFTHVPGIGKKTAQRLLLELKEFAGSESGFASPSGLEMTSSADTPEREALEALMALGYSSAEAGGALVKLRSTGTEQPLSAAELLRLALKSLS